MKLYYFSSGPREGVFKRILDMGINVEGVFVTDPDSAPKIMPTIDLAKENNIPVQVVKKSELLTFYQVLSPEILCFSAGFKYLFPKAFLDHFKLVLNVHGTLLPHYGGARTLNWIIENGELQSGITVHKIDTGIDTGPVLLQRSFDITPFDTGKSLYRKTLEFEPQVVEEALRLILDEKASFTAQVYNNVIAHPNRTPEHSRIDPSLPLCDLINKIRAADSETYPAYFDYHGEKMGIKLFRVNKKDEEKDTL